MNGTRTVERYYSDHISEYTFCVKHIEGERLRHLILAFHPMGECPPTIRTKAKHVSVSLICTHAPMEKKNDVTKDGVYERREYSYKYCQRHIVKIKLGDLA